MVPEPIERKSELRLILACALDDALNIVMREVLLPGSYIGEEVYDDEEVDYAQHAIAYETSLSWHPQLVALATDDQAGFRSVVERSARESIHHLLDQVLIPKGYLRKALEEGDEVARGIDDTARHVALLFQHNFLDS